MMLHSSRHFAQMNTPKRIFWPVAGELECAAPITSFLSLRFPAHLLLSTL